MKKIFSFLFLLLSTASISQNNFKPIDSLLALYNKPGSPGISIQVVKDGKVLYSKQSGFADIENKKSLTKESVFYMASDAKQFTAACIIMLQQRGKLKLEDKLSKYFPDFPEYANTITITNLLNHTAGIKDAAVLALLKGDNIIDYKDDQVRALLKNASLDYEPGAKYSYSNSDYWFLATIVKQVSGKHIKEFAKENIFKPLKMKHSLYVDSRDAAFANKVKGYRFSDNVAEATIVDPYHISGAGLYAPVGDLQEWLNEMMSKKVFGEAFWAEMFRKRGKNGYAAGLFIGENEGHPKISHGGDNDGFHSLMSAYPQDKLSIIVLTNDDEVSPTEIEASIAAKMLGFAEEESEEEEGSAIVNSIKVPEGILKRYEGVYDNQGMSFSISVEDNSLYIVQVFNLSSYPVAPVSENSFTFSGVTFAFSDVVAGKSQTMTILQGEDKQQFKRITFTPEQLQEYCGKYYCKSLDTDYTLFTEGDKLMCKIASGMPLLTVLAKDKIIFPLGEIVFKRNESGKIAGFMLNHPRAKNFEFSKV